MTPSLRELYQSTILEHNARPRHRGPLPSATHEATIHNPLCGDHVTMRVRIDEDRVVEAAFEGEGCALSRASASLWTVAATGRSTSELRELAVEMERLLSRGPGHETADRARLGDLVALEGVREVSARRRCATLPLEALLSALKSAPP